LPVYPLLVGSPGSFLEYPSGLPTRSSPLSDRPPSVRFVPRDQRLRSLGLLRESRQRADGARRSDGGAASLPRQPRDCRAPGQGRPRQCRLAARSLGLVQQGRQRAGRSRAPTRPGANGSCRTVPYPREPATKVLAPKPGVAAACRSAARTNVMIAPRANTAARALASLSADASAK